MARLPTRGIPGALGGDPDTAATFFPHNVAGATPISQFNFVSVPSNPTLNPTRVSLEAWVTFLPRPAIPQTYSSIVMKGNGVFDTLKSVAKQVLTELRKS